MEPISCSEINQNINYLLTAFENCKRYSNADMQLLVQLIAAVNTCSNGGPNYDTEVSEVFEPVEDQEVIYPVDTYHSISIMILSGSITQEINGSTVTFPTGASLNTEVTTLNQTELKFVVKAGSIVYVKYLVETI